MNNTPHLVSAVLAHAERQHEDSEWAIVWEGMARPAIAAVIAKAGATRPKQAVRAMQTHLDELRVCV